MTIEFFFTNKGSRYLWVCLSGPTARSSDCMEIGPNLEHFRLKYEATEGFDQPDGKWTCSVYSSRSNCDITFNTLADAEIFVEEKSELATVTWFFGENGFEKPPAKVAY